MKKFEQLNVLQRTKLQILLKERKSLTDIAKEINVSRQTLYREIIRNSYPIYHDSIDQKTSCAHFLECRKESPRGLVFCKSNCLKYEPGRQSCLKKYPFVCNFCCKKKHCSYLKFFYDPEYASNLYHTRLDNANNVPKTDKNTISQINKIVSPLVKKGQSIEAILMNHPEIQVSALTIRNWIKDGIIDCKQSELRMFGRRIPSKQYNYNKKHDYQLLSSKKIGHKYSDYRIYLNEHPNALIIQLDTVIGCFDGKYSVLTIHIVNYKFQFGILLKEHTNNEVYNQLYSLFSKFKKIEDETGLAIYSSFTEILLTDNGFEFDSLLNFCEIDPYIHVFYCHPLSSFEKGSCERNHELVRYVHYKGWSFDDLTQEDINILFSNINSYPRKSLNKKTPYQCVLSDSRLGKEFLDLIEINKVESDDVTLNPSLLRKIKE